MVRDGWHLFGGASGLHDGASPPLLPLPRLQGMRGTTSLAFIKHETLSSTCLPSGSDIKANSRCQVTFTTLASVPSTPVLSLFVVPLPLLQALEACWISAPCHPGCNLHLVSLAFDS